MIGVRVRVRVGIRIRVVVVTRDRKGCNVYSSIAEGGGRAVASRPRLEGRMCSMLSVIRGRDLELGLGLGIPALARALKSCLGLEVGLVLLSTRLCRSPNMRPLLGQSHFN